MYRIVIILWACTYGVLAGAVFGLLALKEYIAHTYRSLHIEWKKHPERLYRKILYTSHKNQHIISASFINNRDLAEKLSIYAFFPLLLALAMLCLAFGFLPIYLLKGIFYGPRYVLQEGLVIQ